MRDRLPTVSAQVWLPAADLVSHWTKGTQRPEAKRSHEEMDKTKAKPLADDYVGPTRFLYNPVR
jgi:hypothetical protein